MPADITAAPTAARTYNVPAAVVASVADALSATQTPNHHPDAQLANKLVSGKAVLDDVVHVFAADGASDTYPLCGGDAGKEWSTKIMDGIKRETERDQTATLDKYGYSPDEYAYAGITDETDEDLVTTVIRFPLTDHTLAHAEALTAGGWSPAVFDFSGEDFHTYGVGLDSDMFAFTASALIDEGAAGVLLSYSDPIGFFPEPPLLASGIIDNEGEDGVVYAIVDEMDSSAIIDVIMVTPGQDRPYVYRRASGDWKLDNSLYHAFLSATPPPIVELTGTSRELILSNADATASKMLSIAGPGIAEAGDNAINQMAGRVVEQGAKKLEEPHPKVPTQRPPGAKALPENREKRTPEDSEEGPNSRPPVTASLRATYDADLAAIDAEHQRQRNEAAAWYYSDEGYRSGYSLTAALAQIDEDHQTQVLQYREGFVASALAEIKDTQAQLRAQTQVVAPALTAASKAGNAPFVHDKPGQRKAENLRLYWVKGKGAVKIRWGTSGDFTRCVRQLSKYMGERTEGWCALRHREAAGMWPGDKRNK